MCTESPTRTKAGDKAVHYLIGIVIGGSLTNWLSNHLFTANTIWWIGPATALALVCALLYQGRYLSLDRPTLLQRAIAYTLLAALVVSTVTIHFTNPPLEVTLIAPFCFTIAAALLWWPTLHHTMTLRDTLLGVSLIMLGIAIIIVRLEQGTQSDLQRFYGSFFLAAAAIVAGTGFLKKARPLFGAALMLLGCQLLCDILPPKVEVDIQHIAEKDHISATTCILAASYFAFGLAFFLLPRWFLAIGFILYQASSFLLGTEAKIRLLDLFLEVTDPSNISIVTLMQYIGGSGIANGSVLNAAGALLFAATALSWNTTSRELKRLLLGLSFTTCGLADLVQWIGEYETLWFHPALKESTDPSLYLNWVPLMLFGLAFFRPEGTKIFGIAFVALGIKIAYAMLDEPFVNDAYRIVDVTAVLVGAALVFGGISRAMQWHSLQKHLEQGWGKLLSPLPRPLTLSTAGPGKESLPTSIQLPGSEQLLAEQRTTGKDDCTCPHHHTSHII